MAPFVLSMEVRVEAVIFNPERLGFVTTCAVWVTHKVNLLYLTPQVTVLNIKPRPQPYSNINQVFQVPKHNRQNVKQDSVLC